MEATFVRVVRYEVQAVCRTPLRSADGSRDPESVLRRERDGRAFLQGASLAGALRSWCAAHVGPELTESLFGIRNRSGHLLVSNALFSEDAVAVTRPRLSVDRRTGSAAPPRKTTLAHICPGAALRFTLTWLGGREDGGELAALERALGALNAGEIRLGALKSNGFGEVGLRVVRRVFDLFQAEDREAWLRDAPGGELLTLSVPAPARETVFTVTGRFDGILVTSSARTYTDDSRAAGYQANAEENGRKILPAASVRGAVRARAATISNWLCLDGSEISVLFGEPGQGGKSGTAGTARFEDVRLDGTQRQVARIRINRFTAGIVEQNLFFEKPLCCEVCFRIAVPSEDTAGCALMAYALRDLGLGLYSLGSGGSFGRGYLLSPAVDAMTPEGERARLRFDPERGCTAEDPDEILSRWNRALDGRRARS